jgi:hypothetical protein
MLMRTPASVRQFLAAMACVASPVMGQLPTTRLDAVFPPGLQAGSETTVALTGLDLAEVDRLIFSDAGLSAVHGEGLNFKVTASAGIQPGLYEVRAAGRYGISASRLFAVGTLPELLESGAHDTPEKALLLTLPITVNGTTGTDAADYFRFAASKGQRFLLSCAAERIDSPLNTVLTLFDPAGRELSTAHRTHSGDAIIELTAPQDGEFVVKIHDMVWQGGADHVYRLTAAPVTVGADGEDPALPLSGAVCDWMPQQPVTALKEAAPKATAAHQLVLPSVVAAAPGSQDWFEFTGSKDRKVMIDVLSHRLGHPSDWMLQVFKITRDAAGQEKSERIAEFDDTAAPAGAESLTLGSRDPSGSLVCEENTVYRLQLTDRFHAKKPWQLVVRDPQPGFSVVAFSESPATKGPALHRWSPLLRRGGSSLVQVAVLRRDGFDAPVTLRMEGLPEGVSAGEVTLPKGVSTASLVVRAAPGAKAWNGRIRLTGTSGETVVAAREAIPRWTVGNRATERVSLRLSSEGCVLAVTEAEAAPLLVEPAEQKIYESSLAGSIEVPVKFTRDASLKGFKGEWEAVLMGMPGLRQAPVVKPAADASEAKLVLDLKTKDGNAFTPGNWTIHASARGIILWQPNDKDPVRELAESAYSAPIQLHIEPSPVRLTGPATLTLAPGGKVEMPLKLERRYGFTGAVTIELAVPSGIKGITATALTAAPEHAEAKLVIEAAADAPLGSHACTLQAKCEWNGETLPWSIPVNLEVKP